MNVIGERLSVVKSTDPSKVGIEGTVLLDTAKTLVIGSGGRTLRVEKAGSVFQVCSSGRVVLDSDISGRLEDRGGGRRK